MIALIHEKQIRTVECDFLVRQKIKDIVIQPTFFKGTGIDIAQGIHYIQPWTMWMYTMCLVFWTFMIWSTPWTANSTVFATGYSTYTQHTLILFYPVLFIDIDYLSSHIVSSWRSKEFLGNSFAQYWHSAGNSDTAFSTAKFRDGDVLLISILQLGHVAISSLSLASARTWVKQPAHIKCPFVHCEHCCSMYY